MVRPTVHNALLYWRTLRHLKVVQWRYWLKNALASAYRRRFPGRVGRALARRLPKVVTRCAQPARVGWFERIYDGSHGTFCAEEVLRGRYTFLNRSKEFDGLPAWRNPEFTYLWDFNLHYFEYFNALRSTLAGSPPERRDAAAAGIRSLLHGWIDGNPCPVMPAWHPYPTSLRAINWIKLLVDHPPLADDAVLRSLYAQLLFVERNLEGHLQANHLLENGRALVFGGLFFEGEGAGRWFATGMDILKREIREEYLPRGGHYERSPMYHCILLEALLDVNVYLEAHGRDTAWLVDPLRRMCSWLDDIQCPDGTFPLFNDAAVGVSAAPAELLGEAGRIVSYRPKTQFEPVRNCDEFFVLDGAPFFCVVDGAPIGPSYNPGHAHSDNLSYELFFHGRRLVVDSGTYSYDVDRDRVASRSTAAHNTVVVNGLEQSEVWASFRVARRSNPALARAGAAGRCLVFQGAYSNRVAPSQGIRHERLVVLRRPDWLLVWDTIGARGDVRAESHCHLAPGWSARGEGEHYVLRCDREPPVYVYPIRTAEASTFDDRWAPEFGKHVPIERLTFVAEGRRRVETGYLFSTVPLAGESTVSVRRQSDRLDVCIDRESVSIDLRELAP